MEKKEKPVLANYLNSHLIEAGIDEAGRGCYAGPVFAAAVILPKDFYHPLLNDSKQLNEKQRLLLKPIIEKEALAYAVASISNDIIDEVNILQATYMAMHNAIDALSIQPEHLLIDGNRFKPHAIPHTTVIKGDGKFAHIAAASILAKTYRDAYLDEIAIEFPQYQWAKNKGYGTLVHRDAIDKHGICKYHRKSFNILSSQMALEF